MSGVYTFLLIFHVLAFTSAFGPVMIFAVLTRTAAAAGGAEASRLTKIAAITSGKVALPALVATVIMGFGLVGTSSGRFELSDTWISASLSIALALIAILYFVITPGLLKVSDAYKMAKPDEAAIKSSLTTVRIATVVYQLSFIAIVWLMVAKP